MNTTPAIQTTAIVPIEAVKEQARDFLRNSISDSTRRSHEYDWRQFSQWCRQRNVEALPATPETIVLYVTDLSAAYKPGSLQRKLASISVAHQAKGYESPTRSPMVRKTLRGLKRTLLEQGIDTAPEQKAPLLVKHIKAMLEELPDNLQGARDRAVLLLGFAAALRRSELAALKVSDITFADDHMAVRIRFSKTDQTGHGETLKIGYAQRRALCPVHAVREWKHAANIEDGPLFRGVTKYQTARATGMHAGSINRLVKRLVKRIGLDPDDYGAHSMRAGFATESANRGVSMTTWMQVTRHKSMQIAAGYVRQSDAFDFNGTAGAGL